MLRQAVAFTVLAATLVGCSSRDDSKEFFSVPYVNVRLPRLPGWQQDQTVVPSPDGQGIVLRLTRAGSVPGSVRVDVVLDAKGETPTVLEDFLTRNLRDMGQLEAKNNIRIVDVQQKTVRVGELRAVRVRHEYSIGTGAKQVAITQLSTFLVIDGRGVAITAVGRTELFHPLAESVESMLDGITATSKYRVPGDVKAPPGFDPSAVQPIDLGKIGGPAK
jgi:hypothetical protein